ncbi:MAG: hypothetical protein WKF96_08095 [Solirubrobacteraceae bacterium]
MNVQTLGLSPKLYLPVSAALTGLLTSWVATGEFDGGELRGLLATVVLALVAYVAPPGELDTVGGEVELPDEDEPLDGPVVA